MKRNESVSTPPTAVVSVSIGNPLPTSPAEFRTALRTILDYLWDDESEAYAGLPPQERGLHVFPSLLVVRQWLDESADRPSAEFDNSLRGGSVDKGGQHE